MSGTSGGSMPELLKKMVSKRKKKSSRDNKKEATIGSGETVGSGEKIASTPETAPSGSMPSTRRKKDRTVEEDVTKTSIQKKEKKKKNKGNKEDKDDQSTEFETVHVASRPAVSKNKRRSLQFPDQKEDAKEQPSVPSSSAGSSNSNTNSNTERLKDRFKDKEKDKKKVDDEPTVFQKVKAAERPAKTRMRSHRSFHSKEKEKKRPEQVTKTASSDKEKTAKEKLQPAAVIGPLDREQSDDAPTTFEKINADVRPAIVIEKPRRKSRRSTKEQRKNATREEEEGSNVEEGNNNTPPPHQSPAAVTTPEAESPAVHSEKAKRMPPTEKAEENQQNYDANDATAEEVDVPEHAAYTFEIWKSGTKPKVVEKPKETKPEPKSDKKDKDDDDDLPKSDYIIKY
uniref:Uncharacterized protein n=1 Tax=Panagrolaimus sp. ES5 TaxID=591445 RepID=A0AC34F873_9BILA